MSKEKLNRLIDKAIGKDGPLRVPAYWMNKLFKDVGEWISETEGSIAAVDSKIDKTKASIPTKVSQLENDESFTGWEHLAIEEQYFGNKITLKNAVIKSIVAPYPEIEISIPDNEPFYEGYLMFNSPKSGVTFTGPIENSKDIETSLGKYILKVSKLTEQGGVIAKVYKVGECDIAYVKFSLPKRTILDKNEAHLGYINGDIIASNAIGSVRNDNGDFSIREYSTNEPGDLVEVLFKGKVVVTAYYGSTTSTSIDLGITHIGNNKGDISFKYYNTAKHQLVTDTDTGFDVPTQGDYISSVEYMEGVTTVSDPTSGAAIILPSTVCTLSMRKNTFRRTLKFKDSETLNRIVPLITQFKTTGDKGLKIMLLDSEEPVDLVIPRSITYLPQYCLCSLENIGAVVLHPGITSIGSTFLRETPIQSLYVPAVDATNCSIGNSIHDLSIESKVFYMYEDYNGTDTSSNSDYIWHLNSELIRATNSCKNWNYSAYKITSIRDGAFENIEQLTTVVIPNSVVEIGEHAFSSCKNLVSLTFPDNLSILAFRICEGCVSLKTVSIPRSVKKISSAAFRSCRSLESIDIPEECETIETVAFYGCEKITSLSIPKYCKYFNEQSIIGCVSLVELTVSSENATYDSRDNCNAVISKSSNTLLAASRTAFIPETVTNIGSYAFSCGLDVDLVIHAGISSIPEYAFIDHPVQNVIINGAPDISRNAFYSCSIQSIQFTDESKVPSLLGSLYKFSTSCQIVVPDSLYDEWISATNWAQYADQIIKRSDWDAQQTTE